MAKKVLLKDIARKAGVSTTLVSYVMNNQKENRINKETAQKIRDIAGALHYRTNQVAKSLKTSRTFTLGVILADISNPFSANLARILEDQADKFNYTVIFGSSDENPQKFGKLVDAFIDRQVDGLIVSPPAHAEDHLEAIQNLGIPVVLLDRYFLDIKASYVALDNYSAAREGVKHLIGSGRKRIGMITYQSDLLHLQERERGYYSALSEGHLAFEKNWLKEIGIGTDPAEIKKALDEQLAGPSPIDALFLGSNKIAAASLKYLNTLSVRIPKDLAIVSFDQSEILDIFYSPVTYIRQPLQEMGEAALHLLMDQVNHSEHLSQIQFKAELVIRESTGFPV
jgi:LacI family transcriptional regulator